MESGKLPVVCSVSPSGAESLGRNLNRELFYALVAFSLGCIAEYCFIIYRWPHLLLFMRVLDLAWPSFTGLN